MQSLFLQISPQLAVKSAAHLELWEWPKVKVLGRVWLRFTSTLGSVV